MLELIIFCYFVFINLLAVLLGVLDKYYAKNNMWRISEKCFFTVAFLGGAIGMYLTFLLIRHKTKHKRFMLGLPGIIFLEFCLFLYCFLDKF